MTPPGDWLVWLIKSGRGWGKTRVGAEDSAAYGLAHPDTRLALVAATFADGRDTMIEGESGLLSVVPYACLRGQSVEDSWNRSLGELFLDNGTKYKLYSSEKPRQLRGPQHHRAWCDEAASWKDAHAGDADDTTWANLMLGLRLGDDPRCVVTTTPKPNRLIRTLAADDTTLVTSGSTFENLPNLAPTFRAQILARYEGTRLGRQELEGEILEDVEGALWTRSLIDEARVSGWEGVEFAEISIGVDPAVTSTEDADDTGIIAAGRAMNGDAYVFADRSCHLSPDGWARRAVQAWDEFDADRIVPEVNNGGDLVTLTIHTVDRTVPVRPVRASRGKQTRAEPIAALYEQGRVHHVGPLDELEDQLCTWTPDSGESPDRLDALVWALTDLMLKPERRRMRYRQ